LKKRVFLLSGAAILILLLIAAITALDFGSWQKLDEKKLDALYQTTILYDRDGKQAAQLYSGVNRIPIPLADIPLKVQQAFLAAEDRRFYRHFGVDLWRIGGAAVSNLRTGGYGQGASTITQQLIKLTHLTHAKTISRKAQEAVLAVQLEMRLSKEEIFEKYLNVIYFGKGAYGVEAASRAYFGKSAPELTVAEGALLAGIIKSPPKYAPHMQPENALERRDLILGIMQEEGFITEAEAQEAISAALNLADIPDQAAQYGWYVDWCSRRRRWTRAPGSCCASSAGAITRSFAGSTAPRR